MANSLRSWRKWACKIQLNSSPFCSRPARLFALAFGTEVRAATHSTGYAGHMAKCTGHESHVTVLVRLLKCSRYIQLYFKFLAGIEWKNKQANFQNRNAAFDYGKKHAASSSRYSIMLRIMLGPTLTGWNFTGNWLKDLLEFWRYTNQTRQLVSLGEEKGRQEKNKANISCTYFIAVRVVRVIKFFKTEDNTVALRSWSYQNTKITMQVSSC